MRTQDRVLQEEDVSEIGSIVTWIAALCSVCMLVVFGLTNLGIAAKNVALAQNAADAAALSGAYEVANSDQANACNSARIAASKNNARVLSCVAKTEEVIVGVVLKNDSDAKATARAEIN